MKDKHIQEILSMADYFKLRRPDKKRARKQSNLVV